MPRYRKITQTQCSRPYGTATCYLHTAIWLGKCQSILTQIEHSCEPDLVCQRISPFISTTCWPAGPMSLEWLVDSTWRACSACGMHLCMKMQTVIVLGVLLVVLHINGGDAKGQPTRSVFTFRMDACDASHGIREGFLVLLPPLKPLGNRSIFISRGWREKRHHISPGNVWERRVLTSSSSTTYSVSNAWYFRF